MAPDVPPSVQHAPLTEITAGAVAAGPGEPDTVSALRTLGTPGPLGGPLEPLPQDILPREAQPADSALLTLPNTLVEPTAHAGFVPLDSAGACLDASLPAQAFADAEEDFLYHGGPTSAGTVLPSVPVPTFEMPPVSPMVPVGDVTSTLPDTLLEPSSVGAGHATQGPPPASSPTQAETFDPFDRAHGLAKPPTSFGAPAGDPGAAPATGPCVIGGVRTSDSKEALPGVSPDAVSPTAAGSHGSPRDQGLGPAAPGPGSGSREPSEEEPQAEAVLAGTQGTELAPSGRDGSAGTVSGEDGVQVTPTSLPLALKDVLGADDDDSVWIPHEAPTQVARVLLPRPDCIT